MNYNFDKHTDRRRSDCWKWDIDDPRADVIPLWVVDMDFEAAPKIVESLRQRVEHAVFGYTKVPNSFYEAIQGWYSRRYGWSVQKDWILYTTGVVPAVSASIMALSGGEPCGVLCQTPAYNHFFSSIRNCRCHLVENRLVANGDTYDIDFDDFERKAALPDTKVFLLCSPHNPTGRIWTVEELRRMAAICRCHGVKIIADEIHSGIIMPGHSFTPFGAIGEEFQDDAVVTASCSKSFNIAGLQISYLIVKEPRLRTAVNRQVNVNEVCDVNPFGVIALQVAFNECEDWLDQMCQYVWANYQFLVDFLAAHFPGWKASRLMATYLAWVDCRASGLSSKELGHKLLDEAAVRVASGDIYGEPSGFIRINLACPRQRLEEALSRIAKTFAK
ncbi:MAG: pyridoxal phosphate-dependent aminotransferase [Bacteroidales bacterium]|nr:pyridoxal phosphate-dependent aminotransferase [Bacteroidales bacterium]